MLFELINGKCYIFICTIKSFDVIRFSDKFRLNGEKKILFYIRRTIRHFIEMIAGLSYIGIVKINEVEDFISTITFGFNKLYCDMLTCLPSVKGYILLSWISSN